MLRKKKCLWLLLFVLAILLFVRFVWIQTPSQGTAILRTDTDNIESPMTPEEVKTAKRILWGRIPWPEWLIGYPACGFGKVYGFTLDDTLYMMSWDGCGTLCVEDEEGKNYFINLFGFQRNALQEMFDSRRTQ